MRIEILGPMRVWCDRRQLRLVGRLQRVLLGVLVCRANTVVSAEVLTDVLWGGERDERANANLHVHVHRLRRALRQPERLISVPGAPGGYLLRVAPGELDAERFESLVGEGVGTASAEPQRAATLLRDALALWSGDPFTDIDATMLLDEAHRLAELRMTGIEELYGAELVRGRHAAVIGELAEYVRLHPLRERLRALLMLALHRLGRRADALDVYRSGHRQLVEHLGLEPTPALQRIHQMILTGDVAGAAAALEVEDGIDSKASRVDLVRTERVQQVLGPAWLEDPPVPTPSTLFGVTLNSTSGAMPDFRVGAVRLWDCRCRWANVQPHKEIFDWSVLDRLVLGAERAGLPITYTMGMPPRWACPEGRRTVYADDSRALPPRDLDDWDAYVRAVVSRYRGRIEAYELWDYVSSPLLYAGTVETLVELVRRASEIIRAMDSGALVLAPSIGDLWRAEGQEMLFEFASAGGYDHCDVATFKMHPPDPSGPPEAVVELADLADRILHQGGAHRPMWSTGPELTSVVMPRLSQHKATAYAVRHFLAAICARLERTFFYNWGGRRIPVVLQANGGPPTEAAYSAERLQRWLDGARVRSCSVGLDDGLPANVWQLRILTGGPVRPHEAVIRWTDRGTACLPAEPGTAVIEELDGTIRRPAPGEPVVVTEQPVLVRILSYESAGSPSRA
ncbi:MAG: BTAD domain-containing putative transcriptional regulator [Actinopolymorphaceae bacterium]